MLKLQRLDGVVAQLVYPRKFCFAKLERVKSAAFTLNMFYVYVLRSLKDKKLYSGYTSNLKQRLEYHNGGRVESTKWRKPFELIYFEGYMHQQDATTREKFFKTQWGRNYIKRVLSNYWKEMEL